MWPGTITTDTMPPPNHHAPPRPGPRHGRGRVSGSPGLAALVALALLAGCHRAPAPTVVVYTSVDQVYSEPILRDFAARTGIRVLPVFDVEAAKTVGLVQRIIAESGRPRADVFWNSEFSQTLLLAGMGLLAPHRPEAAEDVPAHLKSPAGLWTAVGCRVRVLLVNTRSVPEEAVPRSVEELLTAEPSRVGFANPLFGTTATHAAALFALWGPREAVRFFRALQIRGVHMADGNAGVRDLVVAGRLDWGLTDSDDACRAVEAGSPVRIVLPDQEGAGTLLIPGTVALIAGAPHPAAARELADYLVSAGTERRLIATGCVQLSVRPGGGRAACLGDTPVRTMDLDLEAIHRHLEDSRRALVEIFNR